jgi:glutamate racemase
MDSKAPIGIFDSGVGGLTVVNNISKVLPNESIIYFADSKNFPYGIKTELEVKSFAKRIVRFLMDKEVKTIIVACNTVSSIAIPELVDMAKPIPIFGMIQAGAKYALKIAKNKRIGVISTPLTAKKHAYKTEILKISPDAVVFEVGSQELVNLVEDGITQNSSAYDLAKERLNCPLSERIDTLVLGCTHFPFLYKVVKSVAGEGVTVIDPSDYLALEVKSFLVKRGLLNSGPHHMIYYTTGESEEFLDKTRIFLDFPAEKVERIEI